MRFCDINILMAIIKSLQRLYCDYLLARVEAVICILLNTHKLCSSCLILFLKNVD